MDYFGAATPLQQWLGFLSDRALDDPPGFLPSQGIERPSDL
jgi:hypothetical protein